MSPAAAVNLGLGQYRLGRGLAGETWTIFGLGSCIGLIIFDAGRGLSAMAHIVLPTAPGGVLEAGRYADTVLPLLLNGLQDLGAQQGSLQAVMAGGAKMLDLTGLGDIGRRNQEAVAAALERANIPVLGAQVGGTRGRTLRWSPFTGQAWVKESGGQERLLTPPGMSWRRADSHGISAGGRRRAVHADAPAETAGRRRS